MLKGTTYEIRMRSFAQERNCIRFVHPCLTIRECKVPGKNDGRVDDIQKSLSTEMGGEGRVSPPPTADRNGEKKMREGQRKKCVHGIAVGVQFGKLFLGPLGLPRRLIARKRGRFFGVDIIVAEPMGGILAVSPLWFPK